MVWVLFDYGQVISQKQPPGTMATMAAAADAEPDAFEAAYWQHRDAYDGAGHTRHSYWSQVAASRSEPVDEALAAALDALDIESWLHPALDTLDVIRDLQEVGVPLALLSNAPPTHSRAIGSQPWMQPFAGHAFFSADLAMIKPSPDIFRHVVTALDAQPNDIVFVDDRADNVAAAAAVGMRTIHFTDAAGLRRDLKAAGVL